MKCWNYFPLVILVQLFFLDFLCCQDSTGYYEKSYDAGKPTLAMNIMTMMMMKKNYIYSLLGKRQASFQVPHAYERVHCLSNSVRQRLLSPFYRPRSWGSEIESCPQLQSRNAVELGVEVRLWAFGATLPAPSLKMRRLQLKYHPEVWDCVVFSTWCF